MDFNHLRGLQPTDSPKSVYLKLAARLLTVYNFCTPHTSLPPTSGGTTPAMAAGITDHCWTVQALLSFHVPPPRWTPPKQRGRPSHTIKRLIERWCGDHG